MARSPALPVHVALLRGINFGGKRKLPMADLVATFTDHGDHQHQNPAAYP